MCEMCITEIHKKFLSHIILVVCVSWPYCRAVQELKPNDALTMYMDACRLLEDDNREQMAFDTYRATSNLYIKLNK